jgi:hypothetical protein
MHNLLDDFLPSGKHYVQPDDRPSFRPAFMPASQPDGRQASRKDFQPTPPLSRGMDANNRPPSPRPQGGAHSRKKASMKEGMSEGKMDSFPSDLLAGFVNGHGRSGALVLA